MAEQKSSITKAAFKFDVLWSNYPSKDPCVNPQTKAKAYDNQCAIRVGMALEKSGVNFANFKGPRCEFGPRGNGMVLRAQELANWLKTKPFSGCPEPLQFSRGKAFRRIWQPAKESYFFRTTGCERVKSTPPATT
jgi:hypothetical protein